MNARNQHPTQNNYFVFSLSGEKLRESNLVLQEKWDVLLVKTSKTSQITDWGVKLYREKAQQETERDLLKFAS